LLESGNVRCWGYGEFGTLGYANKRTIGDDETPASAGDVNVGGPGTQGVTAGSNTCVGLDQGTARCWGGFSAPLGYGPIIGLIGDDEAPAKAGDLGIAGTVTAISTGASHTCVLLSGGTVRCWGNGADGELGYANTRSIDLAANAGDVDV